MDLKERKLNVIKFKAVLRATAYLLLANNFQSGVRSPNEILFSLSQCQTHLVQ